MAGKILKRSFFDASILLPLVASVACDASESSHFQEPGIRSRDIGNTLRVLFSAPIEADESTLESSGSQYEIGDVVEIYDPSLNNEYSAYSFAAQIKDIQYKEGNNARIVSSYDVLPGFGLETLSFIPPSVITPLRPFEYGTSAICDFGSLKSTHDGAGGTHYQANSIPCTVLGLAPDSDKGGKGGWYSVRFTDQESGEVKFSMRSRAKILRIVHSDAGESDSQSDENGNPKEDDNEAEPAFQVGDLVEIYDPTHRSPIVFPAIVTEYTLDHQDNSYKYDLINGITKSKMQYIDESMIHAFEAQEEGSSSSCNVASSSDPMSKEIYMVPCTIVSSLDKEQKYEVLLHPESKSSLRNGAREDEEEAQISIPYTSVQRTISMEDEV